MHEHSLPRVLEEKVANEFHSIVDPCTNLPLGPRPSSRLLPPSPQVQTSAVAAVRACTLRYSLCTGPSEKFAPFQLRTSRLYRERISLDTGKAFCRKGTVDV